MSVKIRLARVGRKKKPQYQIVVSDSRSPRDGSFIEKIGFYAPLLPKENENRFQYDFDKLLKWFNTGAIPTDPIIRLLSKDLNKEKLPQIIRSRFKM
ncbi:MAG: 30S ribosomal protein S16 [Rickettsia sp.]|nr:30S ribosomal protein S16 [Rickettsia sp.]